MAGKVSESNPFGLTLKEQRFVGLLAADPAENHTKAYEAAGFKARGASACSNAFKCLRKDRVAMAYAAARSRLATMLEEKLEGRAELTKERVLEELRRLAFSDPRKLFDAHGNAKPIHTLSDEDAACIAGVEVVIKNAKAGDGQTDEVLKVKVWDKPRSLEMLAKHFVLLTEKVEVAGDDALIERLTRGRERARGAK